MKLIIGLGNPGEKYQNTRHNVGFMVVEALASRVGDSQWVVKRKFSSSLYTVHSSLILVKPQTSMNSSGVAVKILVDQYKVKLADLWVIHDDLDLRLGEYKIQLGVGPKLHYGVKSIEEKLGKKDFWRVRVGVDNRTNDKEQRARGEEYVLQNFTDEERGEVEQVIGQVVMELIPSINK
ncbi:MAG: Peptidyl-tRNA hydrolase [Candidatus Woesebacteria bacterium GW2011_GWB1_39_12]|uniref:Peptidyl-tRNA hydrolase n=2 Tax=Candidatus Woeseibacteriota TaxID=1752722 RepID=A0A0G0M4K5_9BACT|nr:MAG: Peptidyl-tRNA hydrolase [Candidatus Woesebacteria bacterium GW2011_GWA1_39_12]KKR00312.1 MAG: Peptidyl-tRNA hydrolase [Candidatus Woesebacteria bacterium GW2011_GWB1_39_12]